MRQKREYLTEASEESYGSKWASKGVTLVDQISTTDWQMAAERHNVISVTLCEVCSY